MRHAEMHCERSCGERHRAKLRAKRRRARLHAERHRAEGRCAELRAERHSMNLPQKGWRNRQLGLCIARVGSMAAAVTTEVVELRAEVGRAEVGRAVGERGKKEG